ncbi:hypothetical protein [Paracoccus sp. (in: a-proteobacteria)]|uniref:hypothetical protein n=1 Tax=Paracoccus sp. TaxID=267 RepID=UPI0028A63EB3|nr:hypothetical protein [Paracoccus sp. (in: a-proteobacteria)]
MADIVKFEPSFVGEGYRFDPDELLEAAKGQGFTDLVILGTLPDGTKWTSGNCNAGEALILMERAKHELIFGGQDG